MTHGTRLGHAKRRIGLAHSGGQLLDRLDLVRRGNDETRDDESADEWAGSIARRQGRNERADDGELESAAVHRQVGAELVDALRRRDRVDELEHLEQWRLVGGQRQFCRGAGEGCRISSYADLAHTFQERLVRSALSKEQTDLAQRDVAGRLQSLRRQSVTAPQARLDLVQDVFEPIRGRRVGLGADAVQSRCGT